MHGRARCNVTGSEGRAPFELGRKLPVELGRGAGAQFERGEQHGIELNTLSRGNRDSALNRRVKTLLATPWPREAPSGDVPEGEFTPSATVV